MRTQVANEFDIFAKDTEAMKSDGKMFQDKNRSLLSSAWILYTPNTVDIYIYL